MHRKLFLTICWGLMAAIFCLTAMAAEEKTQGEFAVQLCKAIGLEVPAGDYIAQLQAQGIEPEEGWQANKAISNREMATLLAKALGLEQKIEERVARKIDEAYRNKATIIRLEGNVKVKLGKAEVWVPAELGMKLSQADSIKTESDSWVELRVGMVGGIRIKENTELDLVELSSTPKGAENIIMYMNVGEMLVDARGIDPDSNFQVRTPTTVAGVRGTIYNVKVVKGVTEIEEAR